MIISVNALAVLVGVSLFVTVAAPILLCALFIRDKKRGQLW